MNAEKQNKPKTVQFYTYSFDSLLKYEPLAEARLENIDERLVQKFTVWALARHCETDEERMCSVATVNRWRATLRKALRMARRWKLIQTVPEIPRLKGERERSFVFTEALRKKYDELAPEPLNSLIQFSCEIGICEREMIDLLKPDVHMTEKADEWGHYGYVHIRNGKTEFRPAQPSDHSSCQSDSHEVDGEIEDRPRVHARGRCQSHFSFHVDSTARAYAGTAEPALG